jgi:branched-chain amino acid aminotransferase
METQNNVEGYEMEENWLVYVNGEMVPMRDAKISVFDRSFQYGDGVFEGLRAYKGLIFKLREHVDRLYRSAAAIRIDIPLTKEEFSNAIKRVVRENRFSDAHIKPQVSRGNAFKLGLNPFNTTKPNIVIPARPIGESLFKTEGFKLATANVRKIPAMCLDPRIKSSIYLVQILARFDAMAVGADEAIMLDIHGNISEGCGDNIFVVKNGELYTPPAWQALEGITRAVVIEMAKREGYRVHETQLTLYDAYTADEVFITGSAAGIISVTEVDRIVISQGAPGKITQKLAILYKEEVKKGESAYE